MPKKYTKKRYKKSYRRRFNDRKINTKIEAKIKQIAVNEDTKSRQLLTRAFPFGTNNNIQLTYGFGFENLNSNPAIDNQDPTLGMRIENLTAIGGDGYFAQHNIADQVTGPSTTTAFYQNLVYRITKVQAHLQFCNLAVTPITIRVMMIYVPNANSYTAADAAASNATPALKPTAYICTPKELRNKGIFASGLKNQIDYSNIKHTVLAVKQFKLNPPIATNGKNDELLSTGYRYKNISLYKTFHGRGKKFIYNGQLIAGANQPLVNGNIYITITHNCNSTQIVPQIRGVAGCQYYIEKPTNIGFR